MRQKYIPREHLFEIKNVERGPTHSTAEKIGRVAQW